LLKIVEVDPSLSEDMHTKLEMLAQAYKFKRSSNAPNDIQTIEELCLHNSEVAQSLGDFDVALSWK
jgi:hypothetical protein